jgi:PAP2 superfamily
VTTGIHNSHIGSNRHRQAALKAPRMSAITKWTGGLLICIGVVAVSYVWIDRPVAYFVHGELREYRAVFDLAGRLPKVLGPFVVIGTLIFGVRAMMKRSLTETQIAVVLSALSLAISDILENWLKFAFGSTWPETWVQDNPSLIRDGIHSFNLFHGGPGFAAFPSGHMVAICAIVSVFWFLYLRLRAICGICIATVFIGQLEHVPPELNRWDSQGVLDGRFYRH